jgi:DNA-binding transcriptional regulator YhcF (GntR family)
VNTLSFLILKKLVKRSPKSTRAGVIGQLAHIHPLTVSRAFDLLLNDGMIVWVNDGGRIIARISTDCRNQYPDVMAKIQKELDNEK